MYNWSTNEEEFKNNLPRHSIWVLEQTLNFGLNGKKVNQKELKENFNFIKIDPFRRRFFEVLLNE